MDGIAHIFNRRVVTHNERLTEVWVNTLSVVLVSLWPRKIGDSVARERKGAARLTSWCRHGSSGAPPSSDLLHL
jgi:hypothetical protein